MKRIFLALAICGLLLPVARQAQSAEVSINFFYDNISGGSWFEVGDYGYCWQPDVAVNDPTWRPYADGYWAYTDVGWTWVSYEDFGWATYHYGRWVRLAGDGWVWVPGRHLRWGPAWVSWRTGGNYIGWAPLPPEGEVVYEGRPITGHVDIEFDIGPAYYNFCDIRYIGEPVLRSRIVDVRQNVTYINQTVNVTNITYQNNVVYNYGPDVSVVNQYSSRPIQRLKLERQENVDVSVAAKSGALMKPQGDKLVVAAPMKINESAQTVAPPNLKTKVAQANVEKGWSVAGDANAQAELKQKIKTQDLKKVPPPTGAGAAPAGQAAVGASPAGAASPTASAAATAATAGGAPFEKGKGKGKLGLQPSPGVAQSPAGPLGSPTATPMVPGKGKGKGRLGEQALPGMTPSPAGSPAGAASPATAPEFGKEHKGKHAEQFGTPPTGGPTAAPEGFGAPKGGKRQLERPTFSPTPSGGGESLNEPRGKHKGLQEAGTPPTTGQEPTYSAPPGGGKHKRMEEAGTPPTTGQGPTYGAPPGGGGKHKAEALTAPPSGAATGAAPAATAAAAGEGKGKKKGEKEASPVPSPQ